MKKKKKNLSLGTSVCLVLTNLKVLRVFSATEMGYRAELAFGLIWAIHYYSLLPILLFFFLIWKPKGRWELLNRELAIKILHDRIESTGRRVTSRGSETESEVETACVHMWAQPLPPGEHGLSVWPSSVVCVTSVQMRWRILGAQTGTKATGRRTRKREKRQSSGLPPATGWLVPSLKLPFSWHEQKYRISGQERRRQMLGKLRAENRAATSGCQHYSILTYQHPHLYLEQEACCNNFIQKCVVVRSGVAVVKSETI